MLSKYLKFQFLVIVMIIASFALAACDGGAAASTTNKEIIKVGVVNQFDFFGASLDGFKEQMAESGFIEGEDIVYIYNEPVGFDPAVIEAEVQNLLDQDVDLFFALGSGPATGVKAVLEENEMSAVFASVTNPEKLGLVDSLTKPGGRLTGVNIGGPLITKSFEWLSTVASTGKRIHMFYAEGDQLATAQLDDLQKTADALKIELVLHKVETNEDVIAIVEDLSAETDVVFSVASRSDVDYIGPVIAKNIPVGSSTIMAAGFVTAPSIDFWGMGRQAALLAQQIIRGADAGTLPVEPAQYELLLNLEYGESIGLIIPDSIVQQAGEVVSFELPEPEATAEATEQADGS